MPYLCTRINDHAGQHMDCGTVPPECGGLPLATWDDAGVGERRARVPFTDYPKSYLHEAKALFARVLDCLTFRK